MTINDTIIETDEKPKLTLYPRRKNRFEVKQLKVEQCSLISCSLILANLKSNTHIHARIAHANSIIIKAYQ